MTCATLRTSASERFCSAAPRLQGTRPAFTTRRFPVSEIIPPRSAAPAGRETASRIAFTWLLHLRWGAVACQALLIAAVRLFFAVPLPLAILALIVAFEGLSNLGFGWLKRWRVIPTWLIVTVMFLDVTFLTALLAYTGGPMNPFTFLYLIHIVLGAILLPPRWAWSLTSFTIACYGGFFLLPVGEFFGFAEVLLLGGRHAAGHAMPAAGGIDPSHLAIHLQGMWIAFAVTAVFIVFFVGKIQKALERHQETLARLGEEKVRNEKLAALATLSAGAAHELSTPLATIAVAAGEMVHAMRRRKEADPELIDDVRLIRGQVEKCKEILQQMAADAGEPLGEPEEEQPVADLLARAVTLLPAGIQERVEIRNETGDLRIRMPPGTIRRTLKGLLKNGLDAAPDGTSIVIRCRRDERYLAFEIEDRGQGMDRETLARATEPFFTSKPPGQGMGLGLFLARSVAERYGGELRLDSAPGAGTRATLLLALERIR
jgi:two-component system, sensor histidine kinase RegB